VGAAGGVGAGGVGVGVCDSQHLLREHASPTQRIVLCDGRLTSPAAAQLRLAEAQ
jgi:hypothetical protein